MFFCFLLCFERFYLFEQNYTNNQLKLTWANKHANKNNKKNLISSQKYTQPLWYQNEIN